jgi:hypothetical protein
MPPIRPIAAYWEGREYSQKVTSFLVQALAPSGEAEMISISERNARREHGVPGLSPLTAAPGSIYCAYCWYDFRVSALPGGVYLPPRWN